MADKGRRWSWRTGSGATPTCGTSTSRPWPPRHRLILWEPRGHARSESPEDPARYSFARWALDLKDVLDHLRLRRAHVGGPEPGRRHRHPLHAALSRPRSALLVTNSSSAAGLPLSVDNIVMRAQSIKVTLERGMDAMAEYAMEANPNLVERLRIDPAAREEFYEEYRRLSPFGYANSLRALLAMDHITDDLPKIRVPVLLIGGDRDPSLRADEGHAPKGPRQQAAGAVAGQPLRESRSAGGVEPRGSRVSRPRGRKTPPPLTSPRCVEPNAREVQQVTGLHPLSMVRSASTLSRASRSPRGTPTTAISHAGRPPSPALAPQMLYLCLSLRCRTGAREMTYGTVRNAGPR